MSDENSADGIVLEPGNGPRDDSDTDTTPESVETDDDVFAEDGEGNTSSMKDTVRDLRQRLKRAIEEKQEYLTGWQRAKADFVNARKREEDAKKEMAKFASSDLVAQLIPVLDSFEMAKANKEVWEKVDENWRKGVEHIQNQLLKVLNDNGLVEVVPTGEKFDPARDEAVIHEPVADESLDHTIIEVIQKGYSLHGKLLKAPRVKVGEYKKQ